MQDRPAELIERDDALARLTDAQHAAASGAGRIALVSGEAGIGKTSLVRQRVAAPGRFRVLWGGCEALYSPRPLGPLYDMSDALGARVSGLLGRDGQRAELFAAVLAELAATPTVMVLEDLHWADAATLDLVRFLGRRVERAPLLLVLTYRDDELGDRHPLRAVLGDLPPDALRRVPLAPLSEASVIELARRSRRSPTGLHAATAGNPFFVTEALRSEGLPATVRDAVLGRAARQPPSVRALLDLAAIVPGRIEIGLVDAVLAPGTDDVAQALASGLLDADGRSYAFRHELARIALERALAPPLAASLHARVLRVLESGRAGAVPRARLVHHAAGAGDAHAVLVHAPPAAADAAAHASHREAAELYRTALEHSSGLPPAQRAELLDGRAYQCYLIEQMEHAIAARLSALAIWQQLGDRRQEGRTLRWLSRLHWFVGRNPEAESYANRAIELLGADSDDVELAWAMSNRAQLDMLAARVDDAVAWGTRAIDLATRLGATEIAVHAMNNVGTAQYTAGIEAGRALLERSLAVALEHDYREHVARAYANLTSVTVLRRDYASARAHIADAEAYFAARDLDSWLHYVRAWGARLDFEQGQWDAAEATAAQLVHNRGAAPVSRIPALAVLARLQLRRGDPHARALLDEGLALARGTGELQRLAPMLAAQAEAAWLEGVSPAAEMALIDGLRLARSKRDARALGELGCWCRWIGIDDDVSDDEAGTLSIEPAYTWQRDGRWRDAAAAWAALGCGYEAALAKLEGDEAAQRDALAEIDALGAPAAARRARELLRQRGVQNIARGPRASTAVNPAGLTARELQILTLLADRLTNAEIAERLVRSERTVEHHVAAILAKLDVRTRGDAARVAQRLGLATDSST